MTIFDLFSPVHLTVIFLACYTDTVVAQCILVTILLLSILCNYCPQTKLRQGNIFRSVCQEFCSHLGAVHAGRYGQQVGGSNPTGMHTCLKLFLLKARFNLALNIRF